MLKRRTSVAGTEPNAEFRPKVLLFYYYIEEDGFIREPQLVYIKNQRTSNKTQIKGMFPHTFLIGTVYNRGSSLQH